MPRDTLIKPAVRQRFDDVMQHGRILFLSAPCGFGKSALADALLLRQSDHLFWEE